MTQAASWWQQLLIQIRKNQGYRYPSTKFKSLSRHQWRRVVGGLFVLVVIWAMLLWNCKLLLATVAGVSVMVLIYLLQTGWQAKWAELRRFLRGSNRQLTVAVGSGGIATLTVYMAAAIWGELERPWIATGAILQGLGTLAMLALLSWQITRSDRDETQLERLLQGLTQGDPLKRLIAVRLLTRWGMNDPESGIEDYFRLLLRREREPSVREAVLEGLQALERSPELTQPLHIPTDLKRSPEVHRR